MHTGLLWCCISYRIYRYHSVRMNNCHCLYYFLLLTSIVSNITFSLLIRPSYKESFSALYVRIFKQRIHQCRQKSTQLKIKSPFDDDLPNILGINPIEAAILFGILYYVYGPNVLYEYAREAGKLFSTYAPIIKDVTLDIFNEFKDYLEEDRLSTSYRNF